MNMFIVNALTIFSIVTFAPSVSAWPALSRNCTTALRKIAESSAAECLNANTLVPLLTLGDTASIDPPINTWLQGLCYNGPSCNNAVLTNITNTIKTECGHDLKAGGLPETTTNHLPQLAIQYYVPVIDALCVRNISDVTPNENFCTTYELDLLQAGIGHNLTTHNFLSSIVDVLVRNSTLQTSLVCTPCAEGTYAIVRPLLGNSTQRKVDRFFSGDCGSSFQATSTPPGIIEATGTIATQTLPSSSTTSKGTAVSSFVRPSSSVTILVALLGVVGVVGGVFTCGL